MNRKFPRSLLLSTVIALLAMPIPLFGASVTAFVTNFIAPIMSGRVTFVTCAMLKMLSVVFVVFAFMFMPVVLIMPVPFMIFVAHSI